MNAEWNVNVTAEMAPDENLLNVCRQMEQEYVSRRRNATHGGCCIVREWPAIGELGRYRVDGVRVRFVTTTRRTVEVQTPDGSILTACPMKPGMADELYSVARTFVRGQ